MLSDSRSTKMKNHHGVKSDTKMVVCTLVFWNMDANVHPVKTGYVVTLFYI